MKTIYVDIDDTICFHDKNIPLDGNRDYDDACPSFENISKINKLYDEGNKIIYWTARGSRSGIDWTEFTTNQLKSWGVKFHEVRCDKPYYDLFVEDRSIRIEEI
ncbi:hypothetical protein N9A98_00010 [Akkermansiaceae bacterium]|nr:hypothetical protein [Akkermansiaceae bacterium]